MTSKTYAEKMGEVPFDWNAALANPPERLDAAHLGMIDRAGRWATCACGNQCKVIPRFGDGGPRDETLYRLGVIFYAKVEAAAWNDAKLTLAKIEQRSAELIAEMEEGR